MEAVKAHCDGLINQDGATSNEPKEATYLLHVANKACRYPNTLDCAEFGNPGSLVVDRTTAGVALIVVYSLKRACTEK